MREGVCNTPHAPNYYWECVKTSGKTMEWGTSNDISQHYEWKLLIGFNDKSLGTQGIRVQA